MDKAHCPGRKVDVKKQIRCKARRLKGEAYLVKQTLLLSKVKQNRNEIRNVEMPFRNKVPEFHDSKTKYSTHHIENSGTKADTQRMSDTPKQDIHLTIDRQCSLPEKLNVEQSGSTFGSPVLSKSLSFGNISEFNCFNNHSNIIISIVDEKDVRDESQGTELLLAGKSDDSLSLTSVTISAESEESSSRTPSPNVIKEPSSPPPKFWDKTSEWKKTNELKWANKDMFGEEILSEHGVIKLPNHPQKKQGSNAKRRAMKTWAELSKRIGDDEYFTTDSDTPEFEVI